MKDKANNQSSCDWPLNDPLMIEYHDIEWGVPVHDDRKHFEFMLLDCFQAGLSWRTVLHKRENFKNAFDHFDYRKVAGYGQDKVAELLQDAGIIRNKAKITASIRNAICFIEIQMEFGSFDAYIWQFTNGKTLHNRWTKISEIPPSSKESDAMSKDLVKRGFKFVGSTICYSYMQAAGMINDHFIQCSRYEELKRQGL
jgi:DNA-3-methyladenine glycosylase I